MLRAKAQYNLKNAREYFREHLQVGDYYSEANAVQGEWFGQGSQKLGLKGVVTESDFLALCQGNNPHTKERLTQRRNTTRNINGEEQANRRIFYDFTISPPKSVSIVGLYENNRIVKIHDEAVKKTMLELERYAMTRVRKKGQLSDRETSNIVGASFRHDTSRALDPHLHTHCVVMNATFDPVENKWKALQNFEMLKAQKFAENYYYHELSKGLVKLGYTITNNVRDFEIQGVPQPIIDRFSKRNNEINAATHDYLNRNDFDGNIKNLRMQVAHDSRSRKIKNSTAEKLVGHWAEQMSVEEKRTLVGLKRNNKVRPNLQPKLDSIIDWADEHMFERKSVVEDYQLMDAALSRGRGENFTLDSLKAKINEREYIYDDKSHKVTSQMVLGRELEIVMNAKEGTGKCARFNATYTPAQPSVTEEQKAAIFKMLSSRDFITLFRGGAGTGKSFTLKEVEQGLSASNYDTIVLAPQRQQVIDLEKDGFRAQTIAQFLVKKELPTNAVLIVDEAGQIGGQQMAELIDTAKKNDARIIFSGDTRQHGAVEASDALRAIELHSGLEAVELSTIRRQDPKLGKDVSEKKFISGYHDAVKMASKGNILESFDRLDQLGAIHEYPPAEKDVHLANEYLQAQKSGEKVVVVAQTWNEIHNVNAVIRQKLKSEKLLGKEQVMRTYERRDLDTAQLQDPRYYLENDSVFFTRKYGRFSKGEIVKIAQVNSDGLQLEKGGRTTRIGFKQAKHFAVVKEKDLHLASGDQLQLKFNGRSLEDNPIVNGEIVTLKRLYKNGKMSVVDGHGTTKTLTPNQRMCNLGYAVTSYASQGKTVDTVLFSDSQNKMATNTNQWYVSISRARKKIKIFTPSKTEFRENLQRSGARPLAMDLLKENKAPTSTVQKSLNRIRAIQRRCIALAKRIMQSNKIAQRPIMKPSPRTIFSINRHL